MKKTIKSLSLMALLVTTVFALYSFVGVPNSGESIPAFHLSTQSEKSCKVTIKYQDGDPAESVTVTASYAGLTGGQHDFTTNSNGVVTLTWDGNEIKALYIKGNKYEVSYSNGKSYTLTLKQKNKYE